MCLGYQIHEGKLIGPRDMFDDPSFDRARPQSNEIFDTTGGTVPSSHIAFRSNEMEYTTMPAVAERLRDRGESTDEEAPAIHPMSLH